MCIHFISNLSTTWFNHSPPFPLKPFPRSLLFLLSHRMDHFSWFYDLSGAFPIVGFLSLDILILAPVKLFYLVSLLPLGVLLVSPCSGSPICLSLILMSLKILPGTHHLTLYEWYVYTLRYIISMICIHSPWPTLPVPTASLYTCNVYFQPSPLTEVQVHLSNRH